MSGSLDPNPTPVSPSLTGLGNALSVAAEAYARARGAGHDVRHATTIAAEAVRASHPAWPETMIREAVSVATARFEHAAAEAQPDAPRRPEEPHQLHPADAADVTAVLAYALRFGLDGKPRRTASDFLAPIAAEQIYHSLRRAGLLVFQRPATRPHLGMG